MRRGFLTGFHGSAGTAVVTQQDARLWTDSRYWNEANLQLDANCWTLMKAGQPKVDTIMKHLAKTAVTKYQATQKPLRVGLDPFIFAATYPKELQDAFAEAAKEEGFEEDVTIGEIDTRHDNLVDVVWGEARPPIPTSPFQVHPLEYAGKTYQEKVQDIRKEMESKKATLAVFTTLDDVAYLLNVRAQGDIESNPVGIAYATIDAAKDQITLYCDPQKVETDDDDVKEHLKDVTIKPYDDILKDVQQHCEQDKKNKVWIEKKRANYAIASVVPEKQLMDKQTTVTAMKACKNEAELEGMREAHIMDGVAMAKFMAWLEHTIVTEGRQVSEVEVDEKLTGERAKQPGFKEPSFPTIAGVGPNGAIIHYRAKEDDLMKYLDRSNPILIDSGGQYTCGTTDVTRTWSFQPEPSQECMDFYTRVLKGHIGLDRMVFPENTPGFVLDVFARKSLWEAGKDYGHGTGHGVGAALNVHEGPMGISPRWANKEVLKKGMVLSNEPGYYEDGNFGIRIENLLEIQYVKPEHNKPDGEGEEEVSKSTDKKFLKFLRLTMIPIQKNLINMDMMSPEELNWLDDYHQEVWKKVSPRLEKDSPAYKWLERGCEKINRMK